MLTILAFILTIGIIVTIHEFGHFQVARWCGVRVLRFSIGFGQPLWQKAIGRDKTEFVLAAIPLGGYVKMLDERELKEETEAGMTTAHYSESELARAFNRQSVYKRIAIVLAGPAANLLLAILLYWVLLIQGTEGLRPIIGDVQPNTPAARASLAKGEIIQKIDEKRVYTWSEARWALFEASLDDKPLKLETVSQSNELHLHTLSFADMDQNLDKDIIQRLGIEIFIPETPPVIGEILPEGAAAQAGLKVQDKIISIDHTQVQHWDQVVATVKANPQRPMAFEVLRASQHIHVQVTPLAAMENNLRIGKIGAAPKLDRNQLNQALYKKQYSIVTALVAALGETAKNAVMSLKMMWYMIQGKVSWKGISGPVTIASYAGESAGMGLKPFIGFLALVSISIGVLNLLPIPVLDGGHLMYYIAELIKGSPVSENVMLYGQKIGFGLLGLLMTIAIYNDINRIIVG